MSRLLKEDAAVLGEAYTKILNEMVPHYEGDFGPGEAKVDPAKFKTVPVKKKHKTTGEIIETTKHLFLSYLEDTRVYATKLNTNIHERFTPEQRVRIYQRVTQELGAEIVKRIRARGGVHPGTRGVPAITGSSSYNYYQLADELKEWLQNWYFEAKTSSGNAVKFNLVQQTPAGLSHAAWIVDQLITQVLEPQKILKYVGPDGRSGSAGGAGGGGTAPGETLTLDF